MAELAARRKNEHPRTSLAPGRVVQIIIRELIIEGTREGLDAARGRGARLGRPPAMTAEQISHARDLLTRPDNTVSSIARLLGVNRTASRSPSPASRRGGQDMSAVTPPVDA